MIILSSSTLHSLIGCPRRFILNNASPARSASLATEVGTAVHQAMQAGTETGASASPEAHRAAMLALLRRYPFGLWQDAKPAERKVRSILSCAVAVDNALDTLDANGFRLAEVNGRKASELDFLLSFTHNFGADSVASDIAYSGSIDSVFVDPYGAPVITDYKTTVKDISLASLQYAHSMQACIYAIVLSQALGIPATDISYQYIIIKLDDGLGEIQVERKRVTAESIAEATAYLRFYIGCLERMMQARYFPQQHDACVAFNRPCFFANECDGAHMKAAIENAERADCSYRYAYLDTGKTDYDIRGTLTL